MYQYIWLNKSINVQTKCPHAQVNVKPNTHYGGF